MWVAWLKQQSEKVFYLFPADLKRSVWMFNYTVDDADDKAMFRHIPTRIPLRCELPQNHPEICGSVLEQSGCPEGILKAGVWRGLSVTVPQLNLIIAHLKLPVLKQGSGKSNRVIKVDLARQLVRHLFPNASEEDFQRMVSAIAPERNKKETPSEEDQKREKLEYMVSCLDADNAEEFREVIKSARNEVSERGNADKDRKALLQELDQAKERIAELERKARVETGPRHRVTPMEFKSLFPFFGKDSGMSCKHDRGKKFVQFVYPCSLFDSLFVLLRFLSLISPCCFLIF